MKQILFSLLCLFLIGCSQVSQPSNIQYSEKDAFSSAQVKIITVDNHEYILVTYKSGYAGGVSIIHSENCHCKKEY